MLALQKSTNSKYIFIQMFFDGFLQECFHLKNLQFM